MYCVKNIKIFLFGLILSMLIAPLFTLNSYASVKTTKISPITEASNEAKNTNTVDSNTVARGNLPVVGMDDMTNLVERKTYDIVNLLQVFVKPFAIICFIGCSIMTLVGAFGHGGYVSKGLIGMFIAGMIYTAVLYAPELVQFFATWILN